MRHLSLVSASSVLFTLGAVACSGSGGASDGDARPPTHEANATLAQTSAAHPTRPRLDGSAFPDKVLALTWDDGPDAHTVALAELLASEKVAATFFVVSEWIDGVSSEPGKGSRVFETGHAHLPVLGKLAALGHRIANHTKNHVLLNAASPDEVRAQLGQNEAFIEPYVHDELFLFRAPGGAWNAAASDAMDADPALRKLVGPISWDIDRKDWESSLYCRSEHAARDCERVAGIGEGRVRAPIVARRYLDSIESRGHGIVLFHDRVGHVGSTYALDIARLVIPELKADGFVFAAPVLAFSPLAPRAARAFDFEDGVRKRPLESNSPFRLADVNADGRADACGWDALGVTCARAELTAPADRKRAPELAVSFRAPSREGASPALPTRDFALADVDGDGRADLCAPSSDGIDCAEALPSGAFGPLRTWSAPKLDAWDEVRDFSDADGWDEPRTETLQFADLDGDGRADVCGRARAGLVCAKSLGNSFDHAHLWQAELGDAQGWLTPRYGETLKLADVNGDGRADLCARSKEGVVCALSSGHGFGHLHKWSFGRDLSDADPTTPWSSPEQYETLRFGDLNGDGRADLCALGNDGVVCAFSTGKAFTRATVWISSEQTLAQGWSSRRFARTLELGDINGDGRVDLCGSSVNGLVCGLAP